MPLATDNLAEIVLELAARPGHETVRADVRQLLIDGLGVPRTDVQLEAHIPEVRGWIDALLGRTVVEFKSDLRRERDDAEAQLTRYITQRENESGERYVGIATDGAEFVSYELRRGALRELAAYRTNTDDPRGSLTWLSAAVAAGDELTPDPETVVQELGRLSPAWQRSLGDLRDSSRPELAIPVYLGDALQWNVQGFLAERDVLIEVPEGPVLHFPFGVTRSPAVFDAVIELMLQSSDLGFEAQSFDAALGRRLPDLNAFARGVLRETYRSLHDLRAAGRNHIWGFVARNLVRPVWLSSAEQRADVVLGNPPWLAYRFMSRAAQRRFRDESQRRSVWQGGKVATHQDLSAYFFARCCELYLKPNAQIAFVMPYAAMSRRQFQGFRSGVFIGYGSPSQTQTSLLVCFTDAWAFSDDVQPLFPVPSCVLFASVVGDESSLPDTVRQASGELPRRNAAAREAEGHLSWRDVAWPAVGDDDTVASPYREAFRQGATLVPRFLCFVESASAGPLGGNPDAPQVTSRRSRQEKPPWKDLAPLRGNVEYRFLRPVYLGESVAPFRLLPPPLAVIPWDSESKRLLDAGAAARAGYPHLAAWMAHAEHVWDTHRRSDRLSFGEQLDYYGKLTSQFPPVPLRVVYATSGTLMAAAIVTDREAVIDTKLYWASARDQAEATYLVAILTSEAARRRFASLQSRGQWGARDFHKVMWTLPIAEFDAANQLHAALTAAGHRAEAVAAAVRLKENAHFISSRRQIRQALAEDGVAGEIDKLVEELLQNH